MKCATWLIILLLPVSLFAQIHSGIEKYDTDSLKQLIPLRQGTALVDVYNKLATSYSFDDPPLCEHYAGLAIDLATELDYKKGIGDAERFTGLMYMYAGRYPDAVIHFYNALDNYEQTEDLYGLAKLYLDFAKLNFYTSNYSKSEEYGDKSYEYFTKENPDGNTVGTLRDISRLKSAFGLLYRTTNRSEKARQIYLWYYGIMQENDFEITDQLVHTQLLAGCCNETGMPDSAIYYYTLTLDFPEVNRSIKALKMESILWIGDVYYAQGRYPEAIQRYNEVYHVMNEWGFLSHACESALKLGDIYSAEAKGALAEEAYLKAMALAREMVDRQSFYRHDSLSSIVSMGGELYFPWPELFIKSNVWWYLSTVTNRLYKISRDRGAWQDAAGYLITLNQAKDSLFAIQRNRDLLETQTKYETSRKEAQIAKLEEENRYNQLKLNNSRIFLFGMGLLVLLLVIIGFLLIRQNRIKAGQRMVVLEQKLLRSQMNPHFIFNSMASIQDFILAKDPRSAANYLSRFAKLIRNILDASLAESIPLSKEIETIEHYLALQKVRMEEKFDFSVTQAPMTDDSEIRLPALLIQPFVENAIEHGIRHKTDKGMVTVDFRRDDGYLCVTIEDDGVGRAKAREFADLKKKDHTSVSTNLINERLKILNRRTRRKVTLDIVDLYDDYRTPAGTRVVVRVPVGDGR